jgi:ABC-2 type transport system permease protein
VLESALRTSGIDVVDAADESDARAQVQAKDASLAIVIPVDVTAGGTLRVITLGLDPLADANDVGAVRTALTTAIGQASGAPIPQIERVAIYGTGSDDPLVPFAPAIVAFFLYFFVYLLTGVSFLRERTGGTLERLMATPVTRGEVVGGYLLGFGLFATVQVAILLTWALGTLHVPSIGPLPAFSLGLGIPVAGSPAIAFLVVVLLGLGAISLGIFLSTFARTELQVIQFIPVVLVPQFLLSGVLFPVDSLPSVLQPFVALMPLHYAVDALRLVLIQGADLATQALAVDVAVLALIAVLFAVVASLTIRRDVV